MAPRYAVYLAPPAESTLWRFGSAVLGYDAETGAEMAAPHFDGFEREHWHRLTADPRRYGFHGTLKAPFRLADGVSEADFLAAVEAACAAERAFDLPRLEVRALGAFIALMAPEPPDALNALAERMAVGLDRFRAPLSATELAKRRPERLSDRQRAYLDAYGYPYVREEFRFHMTLTGPLAEPDLSRAHAALSAAYAASGANAALPVREAGLYVQAAPDARFRLMRRVAIGG